MECIHGSGAHLHWLWVMPFLFMTLMFVFATLAARRNHWRCGRARSGRSRLARGNAGPGPMADWWSESPRQILDRRYASGEITQEQYERMRRDLETNPPQSEPQDRG